MPSNAEAYNESVPMEFTRALLIQARAYNKDVSVILEAANFPFDPLRQDVQTMFVSREQYSRLCVALFREIGDESGGIMSDVPTPPVAFFCSYHLLPLQIPEPSPFSEWLRADLPGQMGPAS